MTARPGGIMPPMGGGGLFETGKFRIGCNYWASHAGTNMWRDWRPDVVADDLGRLAAAGLDTLRVFPLWPDFQPLTALRGGGGRVVEYRFGEAPRPDTAAGRAGLSEEMLARFDEFCDMAERSGLTLVVGLLTGWMSGRRYLPPAFDHANPLKDPEAIRWSVRFVKAFVRRFRDRPVIGAWDLGNECNCMASVSRDEAWAWTALITDAIRSEDPTRQVVSGMHSLGAGEGHAWRIHDQAELTDILTTHPYPPFTNHCGLDPLLTLRGSLHATAETRMYGDVGGRPCLCEEIGVLGPFFADDANAAAYLRTQLWSLWAHDGIGLLWWCAFDQEHLAHAPYDWCAVERELGLLRGRGSAKPLVAEFAVFTNRLKELGLDRLPLRRTEAVCLLTPEQDQWAAAYSAFVLAKQAGVDIEFQYASDLPLRDAPVYLMPSVCGIQNMPRRRWEELTARISAGATLYLSLGDGVISGFEALTGLRIRSRERRRAADTALFAGEAIPITGSHRLNLEVTRAHVLAAGEDGRPALTVADYGKGRVVFLSTPLEVDLASRPGAFHAGDAPGCWKIYAEVFRRAGTTRAVSKEAACVGLTEHDLPGGRRLIVAINYSPEPVRPGLSLQPGWTPGDARSGSVLTPAMVIPPNDALVFTVLNRG